MNPTQISSRSLRIALATPLVIVAFAPRLHADLIGAGTFQGHVGVSVDALGGNSTPVGQITAEIPVGATVVQAYLYGAGTPFPWYANSPTTLAAYNGAGITLAGNAVTNFSKLVGAISDRPDIGQWYTGRADVTGLVQTLVAANPGVSTHNWSYAEGAALNERIDGGLLAVVYELAALPESTVLLLDGGQRTDGETTIVNFADPVDDPTDPAFFMNMSLGISFSCCGSQVSTIDVNGTRLSSAAGGRDDGLTETDGALITAGGVGDSIANPANPFSTNQAGDDELYNLASFIDANDTSLTIFTSNATNDDNIFFMALHTSEMAQVPELAAATLALAWAPALAVVARRRRARARDRSRAARRLATYTPCTSSC